MTNFNPVLNTDKKFLGEKYSRELMCDYLAWSTINMKDDGLREAIVSDLLSFLMWEKEKKTQLMITFEELTRFVEPVDVERVRQQLEHDEIKHLYTLVDGVYRLKDQKEILKAAMDYCGIWYEGFEPDDTKGLISVNVSSLKEAIVNHGGIDNLAKAMVMELESNLAVSPSSIHKLN